MVLYSSSRFHFLNMRSILGIKAAYISRVAHAEVHEQAYQHGLEVGCLSQIYVSRRLKLLGHILRHPASLEFDVMFDHANRVRTLDYGISHPRVGRPRAHWPEMALYEAHNRITMGRLQGIPSMRDYNNDFFTIPDTTTTWGALGGTIYDFNAHFTPLLEPVWTIARNRKLYKAAGR